MNAVPKDLSLIIPARNERAQIAGTITAALDSVAQLESRPRASLHLDRTRCELLVVDNLSTDGTADAVRAFAPAGVRLLGCPRLKAPCARNWGAAHAQGRIFVFIDADTWIPREALRRVLALADGQGRGAGIFALASQEPGARAWIWWQFWNQVRRLPLAHAKAMPAFMFCTREVFERHGPFDERVVIGEEWPILAGLYREAPRRLVYDRRTVARSSSRRMDLQPWGYTRTYLKYLWAILHASGRLHYPDTIRQRREDRP